MSSSKGVVKRVNILDKKRLINVWTFVNGLKWLVSNKKMVVSLRLLSCESWVSVKGNPDKKQSDWEKPCGGILSVF